MKTLLLLLSLPVSAFSLDWIEVPECRAAFEKAGATGTFVALDPDGNTAKGCDRERAETRYVPASTFKIPHTLFALKHGAVGSVDEVFPYHGEDRLIDAWEKEMGLREAIRVSNVPVYQEVARRIGLERMRESFQHLEYGNEETGEAIDRFWLDGPLEISAVEQVKFLAKLAEGALDFPGKHQAIVREITRIEEGDGWVLHGKTGWQNATGPGIGWWVSWVERGDAIHPFALNMDMKSADDGPKRLEIARACLGALGIL